MRGRQAVLLEPGRLELREVDLEPAPGEILLKVDLAMTCGTDLKTYRRGHPKLPMPTPLGHEFTGTVAALGAGVTRFREGDEVLAAPSAPCGECPPCRRGLENLCAQINGRTMAWGAFADYLRIPAHIVRRNVYPRPRGLDLRHAALLEPLSCVVAGVERLDLIGRDRIMVIGAGPIGLLYVSLLKRRGVAEVIVLGKRAERLAAARTLGADQVWDLAELEDPDAYIRDQVPEGLCTVVECVGQPEAWSQAMRLVRKGGEVLFYGGCAKDAEVALDTQRVHYDGLTLKGAFHFTPSDVRIALDLIVRRELPLEALVSDVVPLTRVQEAIDRLLEGRAIKIGVGGPEASAPTGGTT